jgi:hypothetical protein
MTDVKSTPTSKESEDTKKEAKRIFCPLKFTYEGWHGSTETGYGECNPPGDLLVSELVKRALASTKWISPSPLYPPRLVGVSVGSPKGDTPVPIKGGYDVPIRTACPEGKWLYMYFKIATTPEIAFSGKAGGAESASLS